MLGLSEEIFLLGLPFPTFPLVCYLGTLNLTLSLLFIRPWTNQRPWLKPNAQYTILGPYPYTNHMEYPFLKQEKDKVLIKWKKIIILEESIGDGSFVELAVK